jgi:hypothetical protein
MTYVEGVFAPQRWDGITSPSAADEPRAPDAPEARADLASNGQSGRGEPEA